MGKGISGLCRSLAGLGIFSRFFLLPRSPALGKKDWEQLIGRGQRGRSSDLNFIGEGLKILYFKHSCVFLFLFFFFNSNPGL